LGIYPEKWKVEFPLNPIQGMFIEALFVIVKIRNKLSDKDETSLDGTYLALRRISSSRPAWATQRPCQ
jgi:hypothetical protein